MYNFHSDLSLLSSPHFTSASPHKLPLRCRSAAAARRSQGRRSRARVVGAAGRRSGARGADERGAVRAAGRARALARLSAGGDQEVEGGREEKGGWIGSGSIRSRRRHHHHQLMQLPQLSNISMSSLAVRRSGRQAGRKADRQEVAAVDSTAAAAHKGEIIIAALSPSRRLQRLFRQRVRRSRSNGHLCRQRHVQVGQDLRPPCHTLFTPE